MRELWQLLKHYKPYTTSKVNNLFCTIHEAVAEMRHNRMLIIQDHAGRENEGDLFIPAAFATPEHVNFMITYGKGLVCAPITYKRALQLKLPLMVSEDKNEEYTKCNFTISVDARDCIGSGISAFDRAQTIKALSNPTSQATDFVRPGHIFPLIAKEGLLVKRTGHTEAAIHLALIAKLDPSGVICEIIGDDGLMVRGKDLERFALTHDIKIITIETLVRNS